MECKLTKNIIKEKIGGPETEHAPGCMSDAFIVIWMKTKPQICESPKNTVCSESDTDMSLLWDVCVHSGSHCCKASYM